MPVSSPYNCRRGTRLLRLQNPICSSDFHHPVWSAGMRMINICNYRRTVKTEEVAFSRAYITRGSRVSGENVSAMFCLETLCASAAAVSFACIHVLSHCIESVCVCLTLIVFTRHATCVLNAVIPLQPFVIMCARPQLLSLFICFRSQGFPGGQSGTTLRRTIVRFWNFADD